MMLKDVQEDTILAMSMAMMIILLKITEDTENATHIVTEIMTADITSRE